MKDCVEITRRSVLGGAATLTLSAALSGSARAAKDEVLHSGRGEPPVHPVPTDACDCHFHVYNSDFPVAASTTIKPPEARVSDHLRLRKRLGLPRGVIVTPSTYGTDNSCTRCNGRTRQQRARGVAVVDTSIGDDELKRLHDHGIRGIRFQYCARRRDHGRDDRTARTPCRGAWLARTDSYAGRCDRRQRGDP